MTTLAEPETQVLTPAKLAALWRCSKGHLANLRHLAKGPAYIKLHGGKVLYDLAAIQVFEAARVIRPLEGRA